MGGNQFSDLISDLFSAKTHCSMLPPTVKVRLRHTLDLEKISEFFFFFLSLFSQPNIHLQAANPLITADDTVLVWFASCVAGGSGGY